MNFEFYERGPALVEQKLKQAPFKIVPIGGPLEIIKWREQQKAKEALYQMRLGEKDKRIAAFETTIGEKLDAPTIGTRSWEEKKAFAESERKRLKTIEDKVSVYPWTERPEPIKLSLCQKMTYFFKRLWKNANL